MRPDQGSNSANGLKEATDGGHGLGFGEPLAQPGRKVHVVLDHSLGLVVGPFTYEDGAVATSSSSLSRAPRGDTA
jgi:hypothetical protein